MNRYSFNSGEELRRMFRLCQVGLANWDEVCDFVRKPVFKTGTYLDKDGNPTESITDKIGVILNGPEGDVLVRDGCHIFWHGGIYEIAKPDGKGFIQIHE